MSARSRQSWLPVLTLLALCACGSEHAPPLAEKREEIKPVEKKTPTAVSFVVEDPDAKVTFTMEAPFERQDGEVPASAVTGSFDVDLSDLSKSTGLINVDIAELAIYQQSAEEAGNYGERSKSDLQNEHMRDWLEIGDDAPAEDAKKNRLIQFAIANVENPSVASLSAAGGATQTITFTAVGEFRLHQRVATKKAEIEATFHFEGEFPTSVDVKTVKPLKLELAEYDVHPRKGFGKLADKTLEMMAPKVARDADVNVQFHAAAAPTISPSATSPSATSPSTTSPSTTSPSTTSPSATSPSTTSPSTRR